ncbi:MAG: hypothetical protein ABI388_10810 [Bacteroidia bacterium]
MYSTLADIVKELQKNDQIVIKHFHIQQTSENDLKNVVDSLPYALDKSIIQFYKEFGGFQLQWIHKENPRFEGNHNIISNEKELEETYHLGEYYVNDGSIFIQSIERVFFTDNFDEMFKYSSESEKARAIESYTEMQTDFAGKSMSVLDFMRNTKTFDLFLKNLDMAFFVDGTSNLPVILGQDHSACYTDSRITDFKTYIDFLSYSKGLIQARVNYYTKYNGHKMRKLTIKNQEKAGVINFSVYDKENGCVKLPFEKKW